MTTKSKLSRIERNGDFVAAFDTDMTTARFVCMLLDVFPDDEITLNGTVCKPIDKPMGFSSMIRYWLGEGR